MRNFFIAPVYNMRRFSKIANGTRRRNTLDFAGCLNQGVIKNIFQIDVHERVGL